MPKVKAIDTLFSLCINRIKSILENNSNVNIPVSVKRFKTSTGNPCSIQQTTDKSGINPFHRIPIAVLEEIISFLPDDIDKKASIKHFNIEFLITTKLQKLIFPGLYYEYEQFMNFLPKLEKLQVLVLRNSNVNNNGLQIIGTWCKSLRILDVNECCSLTDIGIESFVLQSPEMRKTLQELFIACPAVTKKGVKMIVQHFPALQFVENIDIFDVLVEIIRSASLAKQPPKIANISFTRLFIRPRGLFKSANIKLLTKYCSSLFEISFGVSRGLTDTDLFCLTKLKNLQLLNFYIDPRARKDQISFDKGLAPVLKVIGSSLKVLNLSFFEFVDIWTIVKFCPNLISLTFENQCQSLSALSENQIVKLRNEKGQVIFKELELLRFGHNLSNDLLLDLLSCPSLKIVKISNCDAFTDDFLKEAVTKNIFRNFKVLNLNYCHFVTKQGLDGLMMSDNQLEEIRFYFCEKVTQANVYDWHSFARHKNWDLYLTIEGYGIKLKTYE